MKVGYYVPLAGFCLSLYNLYVLNRDVDIIQIQKNFIQSVTTDIAISLVPIIMLLIPYDLIQSFTVDISISLVPIIMLLIPYDLIQSLTIDITISMMSLQVTPTDLALTAM